jgi:ribosomal protein S15
MRASLCDARCRLERGARRTCGVFALQTSLIDLGHRRGILGRRVCRVRARKLWWYLIPFFCPSHPAPPPSTHPKIPHLSAVAQLTDRIARLSDHLAKNGHDKFCKRALQLLTSRRRRLLQYMVATDYANYRLVVSELGLRPIAVIGSRHTPKMRSETHSKINERNKKIKHRTSRGGMGH